MPTKIKDGHRRDFSTYLDWYRNHLTIVAPIPDIERGNTAAIRVFVEYESQGKLRPTKQPRLLRAVLLGKADLNRQIKDWAQGWEDAGGRMWLEELTHEYNNLPDWVFKAVENLHYKDM